MYEVKTGGDVPAPRIGGRPRAYPFPDMAVKQYFDVPESEFLRARGAASNFKSRNPAWNYTARKTDTGGRIWRTA